METLSPSIVQELLRSSNALLATRYLSGKLYVLPMFNVETSPGAFFTSLRTGSALTITIWDSLVSLDQEAAYIWPSAIGITKISFVLNRYGIISILVYVNYSEYLYDSWPELTSYDGI